ncbi:MAG: hypothetical protein MUF49_28930 [Oculatellaceae cyanobacterium Prado106]|jgi:large exoprotein involved in heme utilization and adhesion|nr:hypothetical protein [Oculatellaceae cyanobacterium Prado106]
MRNGAGIFADVNRGALGNGGNFNLEADRIRLSNFAEVTAGTFGLGNGGQLTVRAGIVLLSGGGFFASSQSPGQGGRINLSADRLTLQNGGQMTVATLGSGNGGTIAIRANRITLIGESADGSRASFISSQVLPDASGNAGSIAIATDQLSIQDGAFISSSTFGSGNSGDITIQANNIEVLGMSPSDPRFASVISTAVQRDARGTAGTLTLDADRLRVTGGGRISSGTRGIGRGGDLRINASQIEVSGTDPGGTRSISISASVEATGVGNGGDLAISGDRLTITQGGEISTRTLGQGNAGNLVVQTDEAIVLSGRARNRTTPNEPFLSRLTASSSSNGAAGTLRLNTPRLSLERGALISVSSESTGAAGNLEVQGQTITLDNASQLSAETTAGDRGNITLNTSALILRRNSSLTTSATGTATGGNITLNSNATVLPNAATSSPKPSKDRAGKSTSIPKDCEVDPID